MDTKLATLTREELYEQVWSTPMRRLAERFNLSDVGLAKICRRFNIPRPPVGYWAKKEVGKAPPRPSLPPFEEDEPVSLESDVAGSRALSSESPGRRSKRNVSANRRIGSPLLVSAARDQLKRGKPDADQLVRTDAHTAASIRVAQSTIDRALRLFQSLIYLWNQAGGTVQRSAVRDGLGTEFCLSAQSVPIHLTETTEPILRQKAKSRYASRGAEAERYPTGRLMFTVPEGQSGSLPLCWKDDDVERLEEKLPRIVQDLPAQIERWQVTLSDRECERRQWAKIHARQAAKRKMDAEEVSWEKSILKSVQQWQQAEQIRAYLAELRRRVDCGEQRVYDQAMYEEWQAWATYLAIKCDPLLRTIPRPGEDTTRVNTPVSELELTSTARAAVVALGVKDTDEIANLAEDDVRACTSASRKVVDELRRVLEGLGYKVSEQRGTR